MMLKKQKRNSSPKQFRDSIKYLKKEEWQILKESIDNFRDKIIINLLYSSGVRVAELSSMKIEEVDFGNGFIRIPKENTKTKESRTVRIGKEVLSDLKALLRLEKRKKAIFSDHGKAKNSPPEGSNRYFIPMLKEPAFKKSMRMIKVADLFIP